MNFKRIFSIVVILAIIIIPISSFADDYIEDASSVIDEDINVSSNLSDLPNINARHAVVFDRASKTILLGKNENDICKMASTTKIMTAIVVIENCNNLNDIVTVSKKAARHRRF